MDYLFQEILTVFLVFLLILIALSLIIIINLEITKKEDYETCILIDKIINSKKLKK